MSEVYFFLLAGIFHVELLQVIYQLHLLANGALKLVLLQEMKTLAGENQSRQREATTKRMVALPAARTGNNKTHGGSAWCMDRQQQNTWWLSAWCMVRQHQNTWWLSAWCTDRQQQNTWWLCLLHTLLGDSLTVDGLP